MSKAAISILVFGVYLGLNGIAFLVAPNVGLQLAGFPPTDEPWIRVVAVTLLVLGYYYIQAARNEVTPFFRWTVHTRMVNFVLYPVLVLLRAVPPTFVSFGVIDVLAALWTALALRRSNKEPSA